MHVGMREFGVKKFITGDGEGGKVGDKVRRGSFI